MKPNKNSGCDDINTKIIKKIAKEISKPLAHIVNLLFLSGIIPDNLSRISYTNF